MNTESRSDGLPKETAKTEPDETVDLDVDVPGPLQNPQAQTLADAARKGTPFCEKCEAEQHTQTAPQDG
ncbi:hypothetical protein [Candidatus Thiosymbion oneisti]|uniref:hypothetical protein n=1 Tax=Candidatus Thiosymbion oneisti TaxID=589554 RepID=UPI00105B54B9|nr:hypothetical protein [Candidatus Thiosymbion oneisti]